jgi:hypothetical protein
MDKPEVKLSPDQLRAIRAMSGADAAGLDGLDAKAMVGWLDGDAGFVARLNRAKTYRVERLRVDVRSLASEAVTTLRELVAGSDVPPAVRLRASLAILQVADAMRAESIGPTSARGVKASMDHRALLESLGG